MNTEVIINHVNQLINAGETKEVIMRFIETFVENSYLAAKLIATIGG